MPIHPSRFFGPVQNEAQSDSSDSSPATALVYDTNYALIVGPPQR